MVFHSDHIDCIINLYVSECGDAHEKEECSIYIIARTLIYVFSEIFSGASQLWFINPFGVLYTLPLYMMHTVFFLDLTIKYKKTSIRQLYWFGVLFGLYEAVITKVLWQGYMHETAPALGRILGVAGIEFPFLSKKSIMMSIHIYETKCRQKSRN